MDTQPTPSAGNDQDGIAGDPTGSTGEVSQDSDDWFEHPRGGSRRPARPVSRRNWIVAGVGAVAIGAAAILGVNAVSSGSSSVSAAAGLNGRGPNGGPGGFGGRGTAGTIASINGSTLTITTQSGQTDAVATSTSTKVSEGVTGSVSAIKVGDHLVVMGSSSSATIAAQQITDRGTATDAGGPGGPPGGGNGPQGAHAAQGGNRPGRAGGPAGANGGPGGSGGGSSAGTVASVNGSTLTLKTPSGSTITVTTSSTTTVTVVKTGAVGDLTVGEQIVVDGTTSNGTITATSIHAGSGLAGGPGGGNGPGLSGNA
jgi:hypothetical protein